MSTASKGRERETFVDTVLRTMLPPGWRCGTGEVTDLRNARSGQVDVAVEFPFYPSVPLLLGNAPRLYLAEGVAAVVEVKSDLSNQWKSVESTARAVAVLERQFGSTGTAGRRAPTPRIPSYAVGYRGWKDLDTLAKKVETTEIDCALCIESGLCVFKRGDEEWRAQGGAESLWLFVACLVQDARALLGCATQPLAYAFNGPPKP